VLWKKPVNAWDQLNLKHYAKYFFFTFCEGVMSAIIFIVILLKSMEMWHLTNIRLGSVMLEAAVNTTPNTVLLLLWRFSCCVPIGQKLLCHSWQGIAQFVVYWVLTFFNESSGWCTGSFRCLCLLGFVFSRFVILSFGMLHI